MDTKQHLLAGMALSLIANSTLAGGGDWYAGTDVGVTRSDASSANFYRNPDWCSSGYNCTTDHMDTAWQVRAGYNVTDRLAIEGGYADLGETFNGTITDAANPSFAGNGGQKTTALTITAVGKLPLGVSHRWQAYGKTGIANWESKATYRNDSAYTGNTGSTKRGVSPVIGTGVEYTLSNRWTVRAGVERYFNVGERSQLLDWAAPQTLRTVKVDLDAATLGLTYHF